MALNISDTKTNIEESLSNLSLEQDHTYAVDDNSPLLLYYKKSEDGVCNYFSPALNLSFSIPSPLDLSGTIFRYASNGWILFSRGEFELFLANPLTGVSHNIPDLTIPHNFSVMAFSTPSPSDPNFVVVGIRSYLEAVSVRMFRTSDGKWLDEEPHECSRPFDLSDSNPVFRNGMFYCLASDGSLATFDPFGNEWRVLDKPSPVHDSDDVLHCFLIECNGRLMSVFMERESKDVSVFRLDEEENEWEKVTSLGDDDDDDQALFVGYPLSIVSKVSREMRNKVFMSRVHGDPEIVAARVKEFDGKNYFVPQTAPLACKSAIACYYPLGNEGEYKYYKSKGYLFSIWYQPN